MLQYVLVWCDRKWAKLWNNDLSVHTPVVFQFTATYSTSALIAQRQRHYLHYITLSWETYSQASLSAWIHLQVWTGVEWPWATSFKQINLGFENLYLRLISDALILSLASGMLISHRVQRLNRNFQELKCSFTIAPVLSNPDLLHSFIVEDA